MSIHEQIKAARLKQKWSMERLAQEVSTAERLAKPLAWQTVQQWEAGASAPKRRRLETVAKVLGLSLDQLVGSPEIGERRRFEVREPEVRQEGAVVVPLLSTKPFGTGEAQVVAELTLRIDWVRKKIDALSAVENLRFLHAYGDTMEPTFGHGDVLLIDAGVLDCARDGVYVLEANQRLYVKRVRQRMNASYEVSSDSPLDKGVEVLDRRSRRLRVLGRAVWVWRGTNL